MRSAARSAASLLSWPSGDGARVLGQIGEQTHDAGSSSEAQRIVHGPQFEADERIFEVGNAAAVELIAEAVPGLLGRGAQLAPVEKDVALVGVQIEREAVLGQI